MKLFTVQAGYDYEGFDIVGIFTSRELAEDALEEFKVYRGDCQHDDYSIEEFEADHLYK